MGVCARMLECRRCQKAHWGMDVEQKAIQRHRLEKLPMGDGSWIQGMIGRLVYDCEIGSIMVIPQTSM